MRALPDWWRGPVLGDARYRLRTSPPAQKPFSPAPYKTTHAMLASESHSRRRLLSRRTISRESALSDFGAFSARSRPHDRLGGQFLELDDGSTSTQGDRCVHAAFRGGIVKPPERNGLGLGIKQDDLLAVGSEVTELGGA